MVTRIYRCEHCGDFERRQSIKDEPLKVCDCGLNVHQVYSPDPLKDVWITDSAYVQNASIHRILQRGGTSGFYSKLRS